MYSNKQVLLIMQIAGAAAAEGLSLKEVAAVASEAARQCRSVGVATHICTLPGATPSDRSLVQIPLQTQLLHVQKFIAQATPGRRQQNLPSPAAIVLEQHRVA